MMRVISSPSISTTGLATLIFAIVRLFRNRRGFAPPGGGRERYSKGIPNEKGEGRARGQLDAQCGVRHRPRSGVRMPGAGTDSTQPWPEFGGPAVVLVEPQLGENFGAAARAMANFGLTDLRLVRPRDGWPNPQAVRS